MIRITFLYFLIVFWAIVPSRSIAQAKVKADSTTIKNVRSDSTAAQAITQGISQELAQAIARVKKEEGEMLLPEIQIDAVVEKPGVSLIPKKLKTDVGLIDLVDRSFDLELKARPKEVPKTSEELESEKKIKKLKIILGKKK